MSMSMENSSEMPIKGIAIPSKDTQRLIENNVAKVLDNMPEAVKGGNGKGFRWGPRCHAEVIVALVALGASLGAAGKAAGKAAISQFLYGSEYINWSSDEDTASNIDFEGYADAMKIGVVALLAGSFTTKHLWNLYTNLYYRCDHAYNAEQESNSWINRIWGFKKGGNRRKKSKCNRKTKKRN